MPIRLPHVPLRTRLELFGKDLVTDTVTSDCQETTAIVKCHSATAATAQKNYRDIIYVNISSRAPAIR
jgi:hypothetical protein